MREKLILAVLLILLIAAVQASAVPVTIPVYTVIPVTINQALNSQTSNVGDQFTATCSTVDCAGFPAGTVFYGRVTSVVRASGSTPGQIGIGITQATLPDGNRINIDGRLTSLNQRDVSRNSRTGWLEGTRERRDQRNTFIGYGAGAGLLIGALTGNVLTGGLIGAAAGWIAGATMGRNVRGNSAVVPAGTQFGILMGRSVTFDVESAGQSPGFPPAGRGPWQGKQIDFNCPGRPYMTGQGILMIPFRTFMGGVNQPFTYSRSGNAVQFNVGGNSYSHRANSNILTINGQQRRLNARSVTIGGELFVPADVVSIITGSTPSWDPNSNILVIR